MKKSVICKRKWPQFSTGLSSKTEVFAYSLEIVCLLCCPRIQSSIVSTDTPSHQLNHTARSRNDSNSSAGNGRSSGSGNEETRGRRTGGYVLCATSKMADVIYRMNYQLLSWAFGRFYASFSTAICFLCVSVLAHEKLTTSSRKIGKFLLL